MTSSIPLRDMPHEPRRDQYGRYKVVPPRGGGPTGYTRVTTVAKALDTGGGLADWRSTMTMTGALLRRGLLARWEALMNQSHGNPWYGSEQTKAAAKELVTECAAVGGANDRKEMGSSLHTITALVDAGQPAAHVTEDTERDLRAYRTGLDRAGVVVLPQYIERVVVLDDWQVAGTFDRLCEVPGFNLPLVTDLKTGSDLSYSWQAISIQQAGYSRANALYDQGPAEDGSQDVRTPMPAVDQETGLILWLNAGSGELELHLIDLNAGWDAFQQCMWARNWRKRDLARQLNVTKLPEGADATLTDRLEASLRAMHAKHPAGTRWSASTDQEVREWLQLRINDIGQHTEARQDLIKHWPHDIPTLKSGKDITREQLAVIEQLLDGVEGRHGLLFPPPKPLDEQEATAAVLRIFPGATEETTNQTGDTPA